MKFIRIESFQKSIEDMEIERLTGNSVSTGTPTYVYVNVDNLSVAPYLDEDTGEKIDGKCILINREGRVVHILNMTPLQYISEIDGKIIHV